MIFKSQKDTYAVFGNPINHSKSPVIHQIFSHQIGISYSYDAIHIPINDFSETVMHFFQNHGIGANITAPFKEQAYFLSNKLTLNAQISQSVNTFKKINQECILGENTDGIGLLSDLLRLNFIRKNFSILILGAGGAVKGVIFSLLSFGCSVHILNRTIYNAEKLVLQFKKYGKISIFNEKNQDKKCFDLIINATSRDCELKKDFFPLFLISEKTFFYDMNYNIGNTFFIQWCRNLGAVHYSDGIGMLVFQAAHACFLWHNVFPLVEPVISFLRKK